MAKHEFFTINKKFISKGTILPLKKIVVKVLFFVIKYYSKIENFLSCLMIFNENYSI